MDAQGVFEDLKSYGARFRVEGEQLRIAMLGNKRLTDEHRELIRQFKPELMVLAAESPAETTVGEVKDGRRKCLHCGGKHVNWIPKLEGKWECGRCHKDSVFKTDPPLIQPVEQSVAETPQVEEPVADDVFDMRLPCQSDDAILETVETERKNFSATPRINGATATPDVVVQKPTRDELEEIASQIDGGMDSIVEQLYYIRDNHWYLICDCRNFEAWVNKYLKKSGRRVRQMMQAEAVRANLSPEAARMFRGSPESHLRAMGAVSPDKQSAVAYEAARLAAARPAPVGERAKWAARDEEGNAVNKITLADIQAATIAMTLSPPTVSETLFDKELRTGKTERAEKPSLPAPPTNTAPPDDSDFPQTEAEARAIVLGETVDVPAVRPDDISTFARPTPTEDTTEDKGSESEEEGYEEGPDIKILRCTPNVSSYRYDQEGGKIVLRVEFAKANFPVVIHIAKGAEE